MNGTAQAFEEDDGVVVHTRPIPHWVTGCYIYCVAVTEQQESTSPGLQVLLYKLVRGSVTDSEKGLCSCISQVS